MYKTEDEYTQLEDEYSSLELNNYIIYKIVPKNTELKYCYVGSTKDYSTRMRHHKEQAINENYNKSHFKLYQTIRQNGGWDEWEMIEIEKLIGKTKLEARIREQELIDQHGANLNSLKAYISEEERKNLKKQITGKYREENKELLKEQTKKYKQDHKEIIAEQMKKYRAENKEKIYEKTKEYKENNKEKYQELQNAWREKNKEVLKEKRKLKTAELKAEKLQQQALLEQTPEWQEKQKQIEEEKELLKKQKRDEYNAQRRLKRLEEKEKTII
jgi:hypothetical protein